MIYSRTFDDGTNTRRRHNWNLLGIISGLIVVLMIFSWLLFKMVMPKEVGLRIVGFFGCHHKSVFMGIPLMNAIYDDESDLGIYVLPLYTWYVLSLFIGSCLAPRMKKWADKEREKFGIEVF